ncbi:PAS-domain containing protein [Sphingomonas donggukensis]|uniref:histidine kinase n=1 Tax=Sphingomonas donggukensis TaxID=2949093 RepID=A0ABY4U182_9SPHN|nr:PAS domain-containing sensor histidine kinase [Sphingomonas donggukensis]URW76303.1 PAS-domain containing protein [Sphingomonas donggukensis]
MIAVSAVTLALAGAVLALIVGGAGWALYVGLTTRAAARAAGEGAARDAAVLAQAPAQAAIVRADGRIDLPRRVIDWLGLSVEPRYLTDLTRHDEGLVPADAEALAQDVAAAQRAGRPFQMAVQARGSARKLMITGARAPEAALAPGGVVLWFADATESEDVIARLAADRAEATAAFDALSGLIEAAPMPMWYRDDDMALAMVNSAYVAAVEARDARDAIDRALELVEGSGMGGPLANAAIARDTDQPQMMAVPATIGGARRMLRIHDVPLPGGGVAGYAVDIEDLEQARGGIKRFGEAQRAMLDRLSAGVAQFSADRSLTFCNQPFRRIFAMKDEWLRDRPEFDRVLERMREAGRVPEVRDFPTWKAERREWFVSTEGGEEEQWHLSGGVHLRVVAQPLPDGGLLTIFEDRTEQVQLASARDTLLRVRTATFDNLYEALGVFAADGRLQIWNQKFRLLWGFDEALLNTHPRIDALAKAAADRLENPQRAGAMGDLIRSATVDRVQRGGRFVFADGRHFEFAAVPLPDGNALFTMIDVTASRRVERALTDRNEALEAADQVKTAFVATMSYELRTPLTSIKGFAEMLHAGYAGELSESGTAYAEAILASVERLSVLVDDVLDLTQDDAAGRRAAVDLELLAGAAVETVAHAARARGVELAVDVLGSAGSVAGDPERLREAVEHLLRHAIDGTRTGGRVLLHIDGTAKAARIVVSDDGEGMTADAAARAFDRFAQTRIARGSERALGLGLPLAKRFVEAHGGTIALVSEPGHGTLVTIELPRG